MAQLRHDYPKFKSLNTEILVMVPNGPNRIEKHVTENATPYPVLSDKGAKVAAQYLVETKRAAVFTFFTPSVFLVDTTGRIQYASYADSYLDEPDNHQPLAVLAGLGEPSA